MRRLMMTRDRDALRVHRVLVVAAVLTAGAFAVGCGAAIAPEELRMAREALREASEAPGAQVAPVELDEARDALDRAEASFSDDPDSTQTLDYSYIALRKAENARARGASQLAMRRTAELQQQQQELEAEYMRRTQRQLSVTQQQLEEERRRVNATSQQLASQGEELAEERAARERAEREAAAALESLRQVAQVQEESRGLVITLSGAVLFQSGQSDLLPIALQKLDQVAETLNENDRRTILVEGHTDSQGPDSSNLALSQRRADSVRTYLISRGVASDRIRAQGLGESRPLADNRSPEGRANNRRVEIVVEPLR